MTRIFLETVIHAPVEICFDLSRNIDTHMHSMSKSGERAIDGCTSGLISLGETLTWQATHFFLRQTMTTKITAIKYPYNFTDNMVSGPFGYLHHEHSFVTEGRHTRMMDIFKYGVPYGFAGLLLDRLILRRYMQRLLPKRNQTIKALAETSMTIY